VLKFFQAFSLVFFLGVAIESLPSEKEVWMRQAIIMLQKVHNFLSDLWILLKFLQEFSDVFFLRVAMESLLGEEEF
jgi:hypothetical protein